MTANKSLFWRLGVAGLALLMALAVYIFARLYPPALLEPFQMTSALLANHPGLFGSAPSLFYTLSIGLLIAACASSPAGARAHCLVWVGLVLCLEVAQVSVIAGPVSTWFAKILPAAAWKLIVPYWTRGVFDWFDLLAALAGGAIALLLLTRLPMEKKIEAVN